MDTTQSTDASPTLLNSIIPACCFLGDSIWTAYISTSLFFPPTLKTMIVLITYLLGVNAIFYFCFKDILKDVTIKQMSAFMFIDNHIYVRYIAIVLLNIFGSMQFVYGFYHSYTANGVSTQALYFVPAIFFSFVGFLLYKKGITKDVSEGIHPPESTT